MSPAADRSARAALAAAVLVGLILLLGAASGRTGRAQEARAHLQARELPQRAFPSGDALAILRQLERVHALPPAEGVPARRADSRVGLSPVTPAEVARALELPAAALADGLPSVAVVTEPEALERLHLHPRQRGKEWEIPAYFAFFEAGEVRYSGRIALRLHGGWTRPFRHLVSHRLYFRKGDGHNGFPRELLPGFTGPAPQRLILRFDGTTDRHGFDWHLVAPLAYDLARRLELPAPYARPVRALLNGRSLGVRNLTEHLSVRRLRDRLGHERFALIDTKPSRGRSTPVKHGDPALFRELIDRIGGKKDLREADLGDVDLDNLVRWWVLVLFCGTRDALQGTLSRDLATPGALWQWTVWDLDQSFGRGAPPEPPWSQQSELEPTLQGPDARGDALRRLLPSDPAFRARFTRLWDEALNHRLTASYLHERVRHYQELIARFDLPPSSARRLNPIWRDVEARNLAVRAELERRFALPPSHPVEITGPPGLALTIDGHPATLPYRGWYFGGREVVLEPAAGSTLRLEVAGRTLEARAEPVRLPVEAALRVAVAPLTP